MIHHDLGHYKLFFSLQFQSSRQLRATKTKPNSRNIDWNGMNMGWTWDENGMKMGWKWDEHGMNMGWKWDENGMKMGWKWDEHGMKMGWKWDENGMNMGWKWDENGMKMGWKWDEHGMKMGWKWDKYGLKRDEHGMKMGWNRHQTSGMPEVLASEWDVLFHLAVSKPAAGQRDSDHATDKLALEFFRICSPSKSCHPW